MWLQSTGGRAKGREGSTSRRARSSRWSSMCVLSVQPRARSAARGPVRPTAPTHAHCFARASALQPAPVPAWRRVPTSARPRVQAPARTPALRPAPMTVSSTAPGAVWADVSGHAKGRAPKDARAALRPAPMTVSSTAPGAVWAALRPAPTTVSSTARRPAWASAPMIARQHASPGAPGPARGPVLVGARQRAPTTARADVGEPVARPASEGARAHAAMDAARPARGPVARPARADVARPARVLRRLSGTESTATSDSRPACGRRRSR